MKRYDILALVITSYTFGVVMAKISESGWWIGGILLAVMILTKPGLK